MLIKNSKFIRVDRVFTRGKIMETICFAKALQNLDDGLKRKKYTQKLCRKNRKRCELESNMERGKTFAYKSLIHKCTSLYSNLVCQRISLAEWSKGAGWAWRKWRKQCDGQWGWVTVSHPCQVFPSSTLPSTRIMCESACSRGEARTWHRVGVCSHCVIPSSLCSSLIRL